MGTNESKYGNGRCRLQELAEEVLRPHIRFFRYPLGPQGLQEEWYGYNNTEEVIVTGSGRYPDSEPSGADAKAQMLDVMKPHVAKAKETDIKCPRKPQQTASLSFSTPSATSLNSIKAQT